MIQSILEIYEQCRERYFGAILYASSKWMPIWQTLNKKRLLAVPLSVLLLFIYLWICFSSLLSGKHSIPSMEVSPLPCACLTQIAVTFVHGDCGLFQLEHYPSIPMTNLTLLLL